MRQSGSLVTADQSCHNKNMKTNTKFVKVYNPTTQTVTEIPKAELAPGMIFTDWQGVGNVWVSKEQVNPQQSVKHAALPKDFLEAAGKVYDGFAVTDGNRFGNLTNMTRQRWLDGFQYDTHPDRELLAWIDIQNFFKFARQRYGVGKSLEWLKDLYNVSLFNYNGGADAVLNTLEPKVMSRLEVQALLELHRQNAVKPDEETTETAEVDSASEDSESTGFGMFDSEATKREKIAGAEVILARQRGDPDVQALIYGRKVVDEINKSGQERYANIIDIEIDLESAELQQLLELVADVKGSVDYQGESGQN